MSGTGIPPASDPVTAAEATYDPGGTHGLSLAEGGVARTFAATVDTPSGSPAAARDGGAGDQAQLGLAGLPARYRILGPIGEGAMGTVYRVLDQHLERVLALKVVRPDRQHQRSMLTRFEREARIMAGLAHPGIVAVHELGELDDGRTWFTMREVRGRTLAEVITELHEAPTRDGGLHRAVAIFGRVCETMAYAHEHGVIHRDLKPANIMVGAFGEALVMDWGLAKRLGERELQETGVLSGSDMETLAGSVLGTPAFMSPEQAAGDIESLGPWTDVYALGAILYAMIAGVPPYAGAARTAWEEVRRGPPVPLSERPLALRAPADLVELCELAMERDILVRTPDAGVFNELISAWLAGAQRDERARAMVAQAADRLPGISRLRQQADALQQEAAARLAGLPEGAEPEDKGAAWELEDRAQELKREVALEEASYEQALTAALHVAPQLALAHDALARLFKERLERAEELGDRDGAARFEVRLRAHDRGAFTQWLRGHGALSLVTQPSGAEVELCPVVSRGRRLLLEEPRAVGPSPLLAWSLPRGPYVARLRRSGGPWVRYPFRLGRLEHWDGIAPGEERARPIALPGDGELGADEVYVPAGWCQVGGDPLGAEALDHRRVWLEGFVMGRFPVTVAEWLDFLNAEDAAGGDLRGLVPRVPQDGKEGPAFLRGGAGGWVLPPDSEWRLGEPVRSVSWTACQAYLRWRSERDGLPWRLPHELEWEKAGRGVDGRVFPWGGHFEGAWLSCLASQAATPRACLVTDFPVDESVYGVRGLAGNVRDWCANDWDAGGAQAVDLRMHPGRAAYVVRGGSYNSMAHFCRLTTRFAAPPDATISSVGLRLVRSWC